MMKKLVLILISLLLLASLVPVGLSCSEDDGWVLVTYSVEGQTRTKIMGYFADRVDELSEGELDIRVAPSPEIVTGEGVFDAVSDGRVEIGLSDVGKLFEKMPKYAMIIAQLWGDTVEERIQYFDAVLNQFEPVQKHLDEKNIIPLFYVSSGYLEWYFEEPVTTIDGIKGHSLFSAGGAVTALIIRLGAKAQELDVTEVAQQLGSSIDGVGVLPFDDYYNAKLYEVLPYALLTYGLEYPFHVLMNKGAYEDLTPELQTIVWQAAAEAQEYGLGLIAQEFEDAKNKLIADPDVTINELSPEEQEDFKIIANSVFDSGLIREYTSSEIVEIRNIVEQVKAELES